VGLHFRAKMAVKQPGRRHAYLESRSDPDDLRLVQGVSGSFVC